VPALHKPGSGNGEKARVLRGRAKRRAASADLRGWLLPIMSYHLLSISLHFARLARWYLRCRPWRACILAIRPTAWKNEGAMRTTGIEKQRWSTGRSTVYDRTEK
jgi:hypothetical protein